MGISSFLKKSTGMEYLDENAAKKAEKKQNDPNLPTLNKQDDKFLRYIEDNLKRINNEVEDMLEKIRVRRRL